MDVSFSYSLRDLLIFSPDSYFKLFELSNEALWPFHIPLGILAIIALFLVCSKQGQFYRLVLGWLGVVWFFVGYWYFYVHFSQISTYAKILSYFFWSQSLLFLIFSFVARYHESKVIFTRLQIISGTGLVLYGYLIHPVLSGYLWDQSIYGLEYFSVSPDPTVISTLGFILIIRPKGYLLLSVIPLLWLCFSFLTYQAF